MKITINYEASWRNSFLDPATSNNEPLPKDGRKFVGSMTNLKNADNFIYREVTIDTVMGILNRLIGDQRKLYQARSNDNYFFEEIESKVSFSDKCDCINEEVVYIRNITGSTDQQLYSGMVKTNDPIFVSDYSKELWGVLSLEIEELFDFILFEQEVTKPIEPNPLLITSRLEEIGKLKPMKNEGQVQQVVNYLTGKFPELNCVTTKGLVKQAPLYFSSLYLQLQRLVNNYDIRTATTKAGKITGISLNNFTKKNFMGRYSTGGEKKIWGNPYMREDFVKGEGRSKQLLTKASGKLEVNIDIERQKAQEIRELIDNAGVSSFYLGKKGLAYVSDIRV
jgi:hypothetical protein